MDPDRLVAAVRQALDDEERAALAATPGPWTATGNRCVDAPSRRVVASVAARELWPIVEDAEHIARQDPASALRRVAAHRKILDRYAVVLDAVAVAEGTVLHGAAKLRLRAFADVVEILAEIYDISATPEGVD